MSKLDDFIEECRKLAEANPVPKVEEVDPEREKLKEFFFPKPKFNSPLEEAWAEMGRCPHCGQVGFISLSALVCTEHGPYNAKLPDKE